MKTCLSPNFIAKHCVCNVYGEISNEQISCKEAIACYFDYDVFLIQICDSLSLEVYLNLNPDDKDQIDFLCDCADLESY